MMIDWEDLTIEQRNAVFHEKYTKQDPYCKSTVGLDDGFRHYQCKRCRRLFSLKNDWRDLEAVHHIRRDVPNYTSDFNTLASYIDHLCSQGFSIDLSIDPANSVKYTAIIHHDHVHIKGESESHIADAIAMALLRLKHVEKEQQA